MLDEMRAAHERDYHAKRRMDELRAQITTFLADPPNLRPFTEQHLVWAAQALEGESATIVARWD